MSATLVGVIVSSLVSILGFFLKWRLSEAREDRLRREIAEEESKALRESLNGHYKLHSQHTEALVEIVHGVDDERASELLSNSAETSKISSVSTAQNGTRARKK